MEFSQEKMYWIKITSRKRRYSRVYAIARDKLIKMYILPDDPIVKSNDDYWKKSMN